MRKIVMAAIVLAASGAQAADMPDYALRGGSYDGGLQRPMWDGFYVGGQASQAWLTTKDTRNYAASVQAAYTLRTGILPGQILIPPRSEARDSAYGGFAGYNMQFEDVVVGVEANYLHSDVAATSTAYTLPTATIQAQSTVNVALKDFGSLRVRGGYMVGNFLPYAFVGFGGGSADITMRAGATSNGGTPVTLPFEQAHKNPFIYGYSAGLGVDVMVIGGLFARAEYEFTQFTNKVNASANTVRVGLGYKL